MGGAQGTPDGKPGASGGRRPGGQNPGRGNSRQKPAERRKPSHREGRKRYVAFVLTGRCPSRAELGDLINRSCAGKCLFKLTYYEGANAVVKCFHRERDAVVAALNALASIDPSVPARTLATSGTIRKAKEAFPKA